jgi:hypothetical protein
VLTHACPGGQKPSQAGSVPAHGTVDVVVLVLVVTDVDEVEDELVEEVLLVLVEVVEVVAVVEVGATLGAEAGVQRSFERWTVTV